MVAPFVADSVVTVLNAVSTVTNVTPVIAGSGTPTLWYSTIVVQNNSGQPIWVATDGGVATVGGASEMVVPNGVTQVFSNEQQMPQANLTYAGAWNAGTSKFSCGVMGSGNPTIAQYNSVASGARNQSQAVGWTVQQGFSDANGTPTVCSFVPNAATSASTANTVTVTFQ